MVDLNPTILISILNENDQNITIRRENVRLNNKKKRIQLYAVCKGPSLNIRTKIKLKEKENITMQTKKAEVVFVNIMQSRLQNKKFPGIKRNII